MGFNFSSNRLDGENFHLRMMVHMAAMAPTQLATMMMAIKVPLDRPPEVDEADESAAAEAEEEDVADVLMVPETVEVWVTWTMVGPTE